MHLNCSYDRTLEKRGCFMPGYLGDKDTKVVHHLAKMTKECGIYKIDVKQRKYFTPDDIEKAKIEGFTPCKFCKD